MHVHASVIYCDQLRRRPAAPRHLWEPYPTTAGTCTTSPASHSTSGAALQLVRTTSHSAAALRAIAPPREASTTRRAPHCASHRPVRKPRARPCLPRHAPPPPAASTRAHATRTKRRAACRPPQRRAPLLAGEERRDHAPDARERRVAEAKRGVAGCERARTGRPRRPRWRRRKLRLKGRDGGVAEREGGGGGGGGCGDGGDGIGDAARWWRRWQR